MVCIQLLRFEPWLLFRLQGVINEYAGLFFTSVAARVINDNSTVCRQMAAAAIKILLNKVCSNLTIIM